MHDRTDAQTNSPEHVRQLLNGLRKFGWLDCELAPFFGLTLEELAWIKAGDDWFWLTKVEERTRRYAAESAEAGESAEPWLVMSRKPRRSPVITKVAIFGRAGDKKPDCWGGADQRWPTTWREAE